MTALPDDVVAYRRTPTFDENSIPAALLRHHATKAGVWGLIHVEAGKLRYEIEETGETQDIAAGDPPAVIMPAIRHRVSPLGDVRFHVEFLRTPEADDDKSRAP